MSESKKGVFVTPNVPVMSIILMVFALILRLLPSFVEGMGFTIRVFLPYVAMLMMLMGMILHKKNLQLLTGIGTLLFALTSLFSLLISLFGMYIPYGMNAMNVLSLLIDLVAFAAYTVTGLHYVLRRPKPGKAAKLILMIPLTFLLIIDTIIRIILLLEYGYVPVWVLTSLLSEILMAFALMVYTPFREA